MMVKLPRCVKEQAIQDMFGFASAEEEEHVPDADGKVFVSHGWMENKVMWFLVTKAELEGKPDGEIDLIKTGSLVEFKVKDGDVEAVWEIGGDIIAVGISSGDLRKQQAQMGVLVQQYIDDMQSLVDGAE